MREINNFLYFNLAKAMQTSSSNLDLLKLYLLSQRLKASTKQATGPSLIGF